MSALTFRVAIKGKGARSLRCNIPGCTSSPSRIVEIAGWPAGRVCPKHAGEWRDCWEQAAVS